MSMPISGITAPGQPEAGPGPALDPAGLPGPAGPAAPGVPGGAASALRRMTMAIRRNRKATIGAALLTLFLLVAAFLVNALYDVLFASSLQFIGLGDPNSLAWGTMLYWAQNNEALQTGYYLQAVVPGAAIALLGAAFALLNYAFDEIGNPALRPVRRRRRRRGRAPA